MVSTFETEKSELVGRAHAAMREMLTDAGWTVRQKLALACRILFEAGHASGLSGQVSARGSAHGTFHTQQFGLGFDEIRVSNLVEVDEDLRVIDGHGMPNPANRFHAWIYRHRADVQCIIHAHSPHVIALSMLCMPLTVSHMDFCPLYDDCAFLPDWPGIPVGNEEGRIITQALGDKHAVLLAHHGYLTAGRSVDEACVLALLMERAAAAQLRAMSAGEIKPLPHDLAQEARAWTTTEKRHAASFAYYARGVLGKHADCLV
ncbi:aldolase [Dyella sp. M7H15-1]|uniref:aldolase n=1 Tax=Dyella sp. M7H15-1 TaxID=2501295 RepID=UPI00100524DD|nr:aldolase [Dyella sp. M7H15-1]QAU23013.1 aldolase [Dyella sp. M7H15-1]